ncbi:MAG: nitroreductase family protein [Bacteroidaceae bacterium]|nr:nitroreductase family protein [Bacteroidaceae bacterium]
MLKFLKKFIPQRVYKLLANGFIIVPKYYKTIITDAEKNFDLALEDHPRRDIMLMRKMAHIIDKGLHREDIAVGHSKGYYLELKQLIAKLENTDYKNDNTVVWAKEKLAKYEDLQSNSEDFKFLRQKHAVSPISFEQLFECIKGRRSNRNFTSQIVTDEVITKLKETVNWAPNSCNKQPIRLFVTNDQHIAKQCLKYCAGGTGFGEDIPSFWCFTANVRGYVWPTEIYLPAIDTSLGAENLLLAAHTIGISGTILSWGEKTLTDEVQLRRLLEIPEDYSIIFCMVMGYPKYCYLTPTRKIAE